VYEIGWTCIDSALHGVGFGVGVYEKARRVV
jgi:hypothetical protein